MIRTTKTVVVACLAGLLLIGCGTKQNKDEDIYSDSSQDSLSQSENESTNNDRKFDTILSLDAIAILGDGQVDGNKISQVLIKFKPFNSFDDYKVEEMYDGEIAPINYSSNPIAREYKTLITEMYRRDSLNFAGHYCFISWMCGCPCHGSAIVDLKDGKVYSGIPASLGYDFQKDSRMLIVNPPDSSGYYDVLLPFGHPCIYVWNEQTKKFDEK